MNQTPWQNRQDGFFEDLPPPSTAGHFKWSDEKLRELRPEFFGISGVFYTIAVAMRQQFNDRQFVKECMDGGDCRAAVVMSVSPLLIATYSDELDCIAMLKFPDHFVQKYQLTVGTRLLTVNNYGAGSGAMDIVPGPKNTGNWDNMIPTIAEFATDDLVQVNQIKQKILPAEWQRCAAMGQQYLKFRPNVWRDGRPFLAGMPLAGAQEYERNLGRAQFFRVIYAGVGGSALLLTLICCGVGSMAFANRNNARRALHDMQMAPVDQTFVNKSGFSVGEQVEVKSNGKWGPGEITNIAVGGEMIIVRREVEQLGKLTIVEGVVPKQLIRKKQ